MPLLKMGTVVDHGAGQTGTKEESEGVVEGADDSESRERMDRAESEKDLEESDEEDGERTERNNKVLQLARIYICRCRRAPMWVPICPLHHSV